MLITTLKLFTKNLQLPKTLLETKSNIFYPVMGAVFVGNLLILINFFIPLNSKLILIFLFGALLPNLFELDFEINLNKKILLNNIFYYILIPTVLLVSASDINFHYDAAYYHLNNQNWLRESNLVIGFVNIFWPFGMSSIYEYLSSILWIEGSLVYLHYLSLIFIHFFYSFIYFHLFTSKKTALRNASLFLILFSILDNFGLQGGRNGFLYIQEVGKQDIPVAILLSVTSLLIIYQFKKDSVQVLDFICITLLAMFIIQLKVSGVYILYLYIFLIYFIVRKNVFNIKNLLIYHLPVAIFTFIWIIKNYLTTGCLVFPLSLTCKNNFDWYVSGSTEKIEEYTTATSFAYMEYFLDPELSLINWFQEFFFSETYSVFSNYYKSVYLNFFISLLLVLILKIIFLKNRSIKNKFFIIPFSYLLVSATYLIFFGPIPRYTIGFLCTFILFLGFTAKEFRFPISKVVIYVLFLISLGLLPRLNSYINFIETKNISLADPRTNIKYTDISNLDWVKPENGDRCWIDLRCSVEEGDIIIKKKGYFYFAFKE